MAIPPLKSGDSARGVLPASLGSPNCPTREDPSKEILRQRKTFTQPAVAGREKCFWIGKS